MAAQEQDDFHRALAAANVQPLWEQAAHGNRRNERERSHLWRWADMQNLIDQAIAATDMADTERRVLTFKNPFYGPQRPCITSNLTGALQILLPGEKARPHRHPMNALRFILEGGGATTIVEGKSCPMEEGDLVLTPGWTWHEHAHEGKQRIVWFDSLDVPLFRYLGMDEFQPGPVKDVKPIETDAAFASPGMVPAQITQPSYSPLFRYPWAEACAALARMPEDSDGSRLLHYVNPFSGGPVMSLMDCYLLDLPKSGATRRRWTSASTVAVAAEGAGESTVGEDKIAWSRNDVFTLPRKSWVSHQAASGGAKLFLTTDREVMRRLGLLEEKLD